MRWWPCLLHEMMTWFVASWGDDFSDCELMTFLTSEGGDVVDFMSWQLFWLHRVMTLLTSSGDDFLFYFTSWQLCWLHKVMTVDFIRWWLLTSRGEDAYTSQWYLVECSHAKLVVCEKWLSALRLQMTNRQYTQCNGQTCSRQPQALCLLTVLLLPAALRPCRQRKQLSVVISVASQVLSLFHYFYLP